MVRNYTVFDRYSPDFSQYIPFKPLIWACRQFSVDSPRLPIQRQCFACSGACSGFNVYGRAIYCIHPLIHPITPN